MRIEIEVNGKVREVILEKTLKLERFLVSWDEKVFEVDAQLIEQNQYGTRLSLVQLAPADPVSRKIYCGKIDSDGAMSISVDGVSFQASINGSRNRINTVDGGSEGDSSRLTAPMPGKVVRVLVGPGDKVEARQPVVVVEAMKMENELTVEKAGTIEEVRISEGESVALGQLLVVVNIDGI